MQAASMGEAQLLRNCSVPCVELVQAAAVALLEALQRSRSRTTTSSSLHGRPPISRRL